MIERSEQDGAPAAISYDDVWRDVYGDMQDVGPVHRHMRRILAGVLGESPRIGHLHLTVDDLPWH